MKTPASISRSTNPRAKLGQVQALLLFGGICSVYAMLVPANILTLYPWLLPFVTAMETYLPAIRGFARASPLPDVVRFYYATMWIIFPWLYLYVRMRWMASVKLEAASEKTKFPNLIYCAFICIAITLLVLLVVGLHEAPQMPVKSILVGGRGNALFMALSLNPVVFGIASAFAWWCMGLSIEIASVCLRRIFAKP